MKDTVIWVISTLMLLVANLANTKWCKNNWKITETLPHQVLIWEYSTRAVQWIPTWQGLDGFQNSLRACALDKSSLSIGRVKLYFIFHFAFEINSFTSRECLAHFSPPTLQNLSQYHTETCILMTANGIFVDDLIPDRNGVLRPDPTILHGRDSSPANGHK